MHIEYTGGTKWRSTLKSEKKWILALILFLCAIFVNPHTWPLLMRGGHWITLFSPLVHKWPSENNRPLCFYPYPKWPETLMLAVHWWLHPFLSSLLSSFFSTRMWMWMCVSNFTILHCVTHLSHALQLDQIVSYCTLQLEKEASSLNKLIEGWVRRGHLFRDQRNSIALSFFKVTFFPCQIREWEREWETSEREEEEEEEMHHLTCIAFVCSKWVEKNEELVVK